MFSFYPCLEDYDPSLCPNAADLLTFLYKKFIILFAHRPICGGVLTWHSALREEAQLRK